MTWRMNTVKQEGDGISSYLARFLTYGDRKKLPAILAEWPACRINLRRSQSDVSSTGRKSYLQKSLLEVEVESE